MGLVQLKKGQESILLFLKSFHCGNYVVDVRGRMNEKEKLDLNFKTQKMVNCMFWNELVCFARIEIEDRFCDCDAARDHRCNKQVGKDYRVLLPVGPPGLRKKLIDFNEIEI